MEDTKLENFYSQLCNDLEKLEKEKAFYSGKIRE